MDKRGSGVLLHITSLPSNLGLGNFSATSYDFIRFLNKANCTYWQVLPFNHCKYGESPYSSFSAFAGNPYFIDLHQFLSAEQLNKLGLSSGNEDIVNKNYENIEKKYDKAFKILFEQEKNKHDLTQFKKQNAYWLLDYAIFMALKTKLNVVGWQQFPNELKERNKTALATFVKDNEDEVNFYIFLQYVFFMQWTNIKNFANQHNVKIIGDMPIYIDINSCDVWTHRNYFQFDKQGNPIAVSGTPPDYFCEDGQLWGNPLYDYDVMEQDNYDWFLKRVGHNEKFFDVLRIDHFAGFVTYWSVPFKQTKSKFGKWVNGPGIKIINAIKQNCKIDLVLEDLGFISKESLDVKQQSGLPGLKIMQYGFDQGYSSDYLPHSFEKNCIAYLGNHDNDTYKGFLNTSDYQKINRIKNYVDIAHESPVDLVIDKIIRCLFASAANVVIITPQDLLKQESSFRMNLPGSVLKENWKYQLSSNLDDNLANMLKYYNEIFDR